MFLQKNKLNKNKWTVSLKRFLYYRKNIYQNKLILTKSLKFLQNKKLFKFFKKKKIKYQKQINYKYFSKKYSILLGYLQCNFTNTWLGIFQKSCGSIFFSSLFFGFVIGNIFSFKLKFLFKRKKYITGEPLLLGFFPTGIIFSKLILFKRSFLANSAGTFCKLLINNIDSNTLLIQLPTKKIIKCLKYGIVFYGRNSNIFFKNIKWSSFSQKFKYGYKFSTRGIAKNPVDHPNGGRTKTKQPLKNPWGRPAKHNK